MESTYCREIEVMALDESVCLGLFKNEGDEHHFAFMSLDIATAEAVYEMLGEEISKAKKAMR